MTKTILAATLMASSLSAVSTEFPSAGTAFILPGQHESTTNHNGVDLTAQELIDWELSNSDIVFGSYGEPSDNARSNTLGYMYNQKLEINSSWVENELRHYAEANDLNYEDFFLHFSEDTVIAEVDSTHGENTILNRKPMIVGYTVDQSHAGFWLYQQPPWDADVFEHSANNGALYIYHSEPFDRLTLKFSQFATGGSFSIEYPNAIDQRGQVTQWQTISIKKDKTLNMTKNQAVIWNLPDDWKRATTHDGSGASYGGGQYFGSEYLRDGGRLYVVRIRWNEPEHRPRLKEIKLKNSFPTVKLTDAAETTPDGRTIERWRKIRGFDQSADINNDNYLSNSEYKSRTNKNATARFRWESRVIPFGRMWNQSSSWALTNLANNDYQEAMSAYYATNWTEQGLNGAYNDDTSKLLGSNQFFVYSGGNITELQAIAGSDEADSLYKTHFSSFLNRLAADQPGTLVGLNIGTANLYGRNGQSHLIDAGSLYLREHYLFPTTGFSGYAGISKFWDNSALAQSGSSVIFQATTRYGRVQYFENTQENWQQDQYSALAIYYLNHHADRTYFNQWNSSYLYGSHNTTSGNYYTSGIAQNIAYQPTSLLKVDIGAPSGKIPSNHNAIPLMLSTSTPYAADYTIVGDSAMTELVHQDLPNGMTHVMPTHTYFAYQSENQVVNGGPEEMVLARQFEKGLVLYRTDFYGRNVSYFSEPLITVQLGKPMRPVDANGNLGDPVTQVQIGGYQGLILVNAE